MITSEASGDFFSKLMLQTWADKDLVRGDGGGKRESGYGRMREGESREGRREGRGNKVEMGWEMGRRQAKKG